MPVHCARARKEHLLLYSSPPLQIVIEALLRMRVKNPRLKALLNPSCMFLHQNVGARNASEMIVHRDGRVFLKKKCVNPCVKPSCFTLKYTSCQLVRMSIEAQIFLQDMICLHFIINFVVQEEAEFDCFVVEMNVF